MGSVCLSMVIKNECKVIQKCLASIKPFIDFWVIVDTGSNDGTQEMVRDALRGVPGELYELPDGDRNRAMSLAMGKGDYFLFLDADQEFSYSASTFPLLDLSCYYIRHYSEYTESFRIFLAKQGIDWNWRGAVHEDIYSSEAKEGKVLEGARIVTMPFDPDKLKEEIGLMEQILEKDPTDGKMLYHLAYAYEKAGNQKAALEFYDKRLRLSGPILEIYYCLLRSTFLKGRLRWPAHVVVDGYRRAQLLLPERVESYAYLADFLRKRDNFIMGYLLIKETLSLPYPKWMYRVDTALYRYGRLALLAECAWRIGKIDEAFAAIEKMLAMDDLPSHIRTNMEKNRALKMFNEYTGVSRCPQFV